MEKESFWCHSGPRFELEAGHRGLGDKYPETTYGICFFLSRKLQRQKCTSIARLAPSVLGHESIEFRDLIDHDPRLEMWFPKMGVPLVLIHLDRSVPYKPINHPAGYSGTPMPHDYGQPQICGTPQNFPKSLSSGKLT